VRDFFGADAPIDPLQIPFWNNFFLMVILIWIQTGFAMVILSAALRGVPEETLEAAVLDGANPFQIFFKIKVPQIMGTILVVWTTITILVLKVFDIVYATTGGNFNTQILPSYMMALHVPRRRAGDGGGLRHHAPGPAGDDLEHRERAQGDALRRGEGRDERQLGERSG
jgi:ABC-type sugar transport system permease subunit